MWLQIPSCYALNALVRLIWADEWIELSFTSDTSDIFFWVNTYIYIYYIYTIIYNYIFICICANYNDLTATSL